MSNSIESASSGEVVSVTEAPKKGSNKTVIVVIVIAVIGLLCLCSIIVAAILIVPKLNQENTIPDVIFPTTSLDSDFSSYMKKYVTYTEELDTYLEGTDVECDKSDEYDILINKEYLQDEIAPLYSQIPQILNDEHDCYNTYRYYELNKDIAFNDELKKYDCSKSADAEDCAEFKDLLGELITVSEEYISLRNDIVADAIKLDLCYVSSLEDNFGDESAKGVSDDLCLDEYVDLTEEKDALSNRRSEIIDSLDEIAYKYVD